VDIYQKAGVKKEDVQAWAHKTYPQFENNEKVVLQLYLKQVKRVEVPMTSILGIKGTPATIADIQVGKFIVLEGIVGPLMQDFSYEGCPQCSKKVDGGQCREHGPVIPVQLTFHRYVFGDNTGDIEISLGPKLVQEHGNLEGATVKLNGKQKEDGSFTVSNLEKVETPDTLVPKQQTDNLAREVAQLQTMAAQFKELDLQSLQLWHQTNKLQTPLGQLITAAGVKLAPDAAPAPAPAPAKAPEPPVAKAPTDAKEKGELEQMKKMFKDGVKLVDLQEWHSRKKLKTPLEDLLAAVGGRIENGIVLWS
jgi:hypothetical protein